MIDLIFEAGLTDLVQAVKLIEIDRVTIRHDKPVKYHGQASLAESFNAFCFAQNFRARRN